jgi:hypothetical protein
MHADRRPFDGFSFVPPSGWADQTMVSFVAAAGKKSANIAVTRAPLDPAGDGATLFTYTQRQLIELSRRLNAFELRESGVRKVDGCQATYLRFAWISHYGELEQSITSVRAGDVVLAITTTAQRAHAEELRSVFDAALASFRVERP